jgi:hypothetical protein
MHLHDALPIQFVYQLEHFDRHGLLLERSEHKNLVPTEGLNYMLNASFRGGAAPSAWYVGLFEGDYTPVATVTAATLPSAATETTTYSSATRVAWTIVDATAGSLTNAASRAEFTSTATRTLYGGFISSASGKGSTGGVLASVVRFASPQVFTTGNVLRITAGIILASV